MGNNICGERSNTQESEANLHTRVAVKSGADFKEESRTEMDVAYGDKHEAMAGKIQVKWRESKGKAKEKEEQLNRVRVLDDTFDKLGKFITVAEAQALCGAGANALDKKLGPFVGTPVDKSQLAQNLVFRKPFQYSLDNSVYHGFWNLSGLREGYGYLVRNDGSKLEGLWKSGEIFKGRIIDADGCFYEGKIKNGEANGEGSFTGSSGSVGYIGNWKNGSHHGFGMWAFKDKAVFQGNFSENEFSGNGKMTWPDKSFYEGNFEASVATGQGLYKAENGKDMYKGEFVDNKPQGKGRYSWERDGSIYFEGDFVKGRKEGKGLFVNNSLGIKYEGDWVNNKPHGTGSYTSKEVTVTANWRYGHLIKVLELLSGNVGNNLRVDVPEESFRNLAEKGHLKEINISPKRDSPPRKYRPMSDSQAMFNLVVKNMTAVAV